MSKRRFENTREFYAHRQVPAPMQGKKELEHVATLCGTYFTPFWGLENKEQKAVSIHVSLYCVTMTIAMNLYFF